KLMGRRGPQPKLPQPPGHLRADGRELWQRVVEEYDLPPDALAILQMACEGWDRACEARRFLGEHGVAYPGRGQHHKGRPQLRVERDSREATARRLRQLGLDLEPLHDRPGRPPGR